MPSPSVDVVNDHWPLPSTLAVPTWLVPSNTLTVLLASAVPASISVLSLVMRSFALAPVSCDNETIFGAAGAVGGGDPETTGETAAEAALVLPATSNAFAVRL